MLQVNIFLFTIYKLVGFREEKADVCMVLGTGNRTLFLPNLSLKSSSSCIFIYYH